MYFVYGGNRQFLAVCSVEDLETMPTVAVPPRSSTFHRSPWRKGLVERAMVDSPSCKNDRDKALVNEINIGLIESSHWTTL